MVSDKPAPPAILVWRQDAVTVFSLVGEHDMSTAEDLQVKIAEQTRIGRGVVVSLQQTEFIDTSIIRVFFQADLALQLYGRRLVLHADTTPNVERVLEIAHMTEQLLCCDTIYESLDMATQNSEALNPM